LFASAPLMTDFFPPPTESRTPSPDETRFSVRAFYRRLLLPLQRDAGYFSYLFPYSTFHMNLALFLFAFSAENPFLRKSLQTALSPLSFPPSFLGKTDLTRVDSKIPPYPDHIYSLSHCALFFRVYLRDGSRLLDTPRFFRSVTLEVSNFFFA